MTKIGFAVDRGGTFTDVCVFYPDGRTRVLKLLSEDPDNYADAPTEAIRRVLEEEGKQKIPRGTPIPTENIAWIRMGTTVATNALLERKGEPMALLITKGFKENFSLFADRFKELRRQTTDQLKSQGFKDEAIEAECFLHMRYAKTDCAIMTAANFDPADPKTIEKFMENFRSTYKREFGFVLDTRQVQVDDIRVRGIGKSGIEVKDHIEKADDPLGAPKLGNETVISRVDHRVRNCTS
ncbi:unnamed protein product, partial [Mesorhabditis spiculigera]